jgi:hydroxyacylglutathione hydrolase
LKLTTILTTHHHYDHAGGNSKMLELMGANQGQIKVVGGDQSLQALSHQVKDNEKLKVIQYFRSTQIVFVLFE